MTVTADFATFGPDHAYGRSWSSPVNHLTTAYAGRASRHQMRALIEALTHAAPSGIVLPLVEEGRCVLRRAWASVRGPNGLLLR